jgi:hypothetical protein
LFREKKSSALEIVGNKAPLRLKAADDQMVVFLHLKMVSGEIRAYKDKMGARTRKYLGNSLC